MKTCQCHCRACGRHFASLEAFDAHRVGEHGGEGLDGRQCSVLTDEGEPRFAVEIGKCVVLDPTKPVLDAEILYDPERRQRVRDHFAGSTGVRQPAPSAEST